MPVAPTYPGVYVEELPSGVHTITGVSTAVTAFMGYFSQGPMNTPTRIFSVADLERAFGPLVANSEAGYAIRQFFANGGGEAWVVRVASGSPAKASIEIEDKVSGTGILTATATNEGNWGNGVRLAIDRNTATPTTAFNLTVSLVDQATPPNVLATEAYRNLTLTSADPNFAPAVVNAASHLIQLSLVGTPVATDLPAPTGTVSNDISGVALATNMGNMTVTFGGTALGTGPNPGVNITAKPDNLTALAATIQAQLQTLVPTNSPTSPPPLANAIVSVVPGSPSGKALQISAPGSSPGATFAFGGALAGTLKLDNPYITNVQQYALGASPATAAQEPPTASNKGSDGGQPDAAAVIGVATPTKTGINCLDAAPGFNLLCLPDVMNMSASDAFAVISAAETFCSSQSRFAFLIVDPPQGTSPPLVGSLDSFTGIQDWLSGYANLRSSYAAVYFPRPQIPDPLNGFRLRSVAASGTIAGLYASTDGSRGVWKAPAGTAANLVNVAALATKLTDAENGVLNPLAINCLRNLPVYGNVCWGARTLAGADAIASDYKYIPVRRLALYIEASLYRGTQWVVFEPNDEPLWSQIRLNVGAFMRGLFSQGAFQGSTPASAYFVKCDSTTTTQADINNGVVNILIGFAPLKPAEFVILQIQQIAGQIPT